MIIFLVLTFISFCEARERNAVEYGQQLNVLIEQWIINPTSNNYRNLNFYILANTPNFAIADTTERALLAKMNAASMQNQWPKKALATCVVAGSCIVINPEALGCTLIGCAMMSGNLLRTCHQDNKKALAEELKTNITKVCTQSRAMHPFPQPILMKKNEDDQN